MSDVGLLATQLAHTTQCAEDLDKALLRLKKEERNAEGTARSSQAREMAREILSDLLASISGDLTPRKYQLREETVEILRGIHRSDWQHFVEKLQAINGRLDKPGETLKLEEIRCLEDIAHALDVDCSMLFQRMQGRHR